MRISWKVPWDICYWLSWPTGSKHSNIVERSVRTTRETMLKKKTHLVTFHQRILINLRTFQPTFVSMCTGWLIITIENIIKNQYWFTHTHTQTFEENEPVPLRFHCLTRYFNHLSKSVLREIKNIYFYQFSVFVVGIFSITFFELFNMPFPIYIYIYIYIYCHPQTDCFVLSRLFSVVGHPKCSKPGSKPVRLMTYP